MRRSVFIAALLLAVATAPSGVAAQTPQPPAATGFKASMIDRLLHRLERRNDGTIDIMMLSGGGQYGAYGAGFLQGWKARREDAMPRFDIVTGISTGSLLAPFALLGTSDALKTVADIYHDAVRQIGPSFDALIFIRPTGGMLNRTKLEQTIARVMDKAFAEQLRTALADDRQLLIGTTELDRGTGRIWDMTRELDGTAGGLARAHSIMVATAAIPGAFAPVTLDGHAQTDGGVATNLLLGLNIDDFRVLAARLKASGRTEPVRIRLWALVNLTVYPPIVEVKSTHVKAVRDRANGLMYRLAQQIMLTRLYELSHAVTSGVPGLTMQVRYTAVPDALNYEQGATKLFDTAFMRKLQQIGYDRAQGDSPWDTLPVSLFERPPAPGSAAGASMKKK